MTAANGHLPVVQYLREQGADKEAREGEDKTPLHLATAKGYVDVMQYLRELGADVQQRNLKAPPLFE